MVALTREGLDRSLASIERTLQYAQRLEFAASNLSSTVGEALSLTADHGIVSLSSDPSHGVVPEDPSGLVPVSCHESGACVPLDSNTSASNSSDSSAGHLNVTLAVILSTVLLIAILIAFLCIGARFGEKALRKQEKLEQEADPEKTTRPDDTLPSPGPPPTAHHKSFYFPNGAHLDWWTSKDHGIAALQENKAAAADSTSSAPPPALGRRASLGPRCPSSAPTSSCLAPCHEALVGALAANLVVVREEACTTTLWSLRCGLLPSSPCSRRLWAASPYSQRSLAARACERRGQRACASQMKAARPCTWRTRLETACCLSFALKCGWTVAQRNCRGVVK